MLIKLVVIPSTVETEMANFMCIVFIPSLNKSCRRVVFSNISYWVCAGEQLFWTRQCSIIQEEIEPRMSF